MYLTQDEISSMARNTHVFMNAKKGRILFGFIKINQNRFVDNTIVNEITNEVEHFRDRVFMPGNEICLCSRGPNGTRCLDSNKCIYRLLCVQCSDNCPMNCQNKPINGGQLLNQGYRLSYHRIKGICIVTTRTIKKGAFLLEYVGRVTRSIDVNTQSKFTMDIGIMNDLGTDVTVLPYTVDAEVFGNAARFCSNDHEPNCEVLPYVCGSQIRLLLKTIKSIRAGQEITFSYGSSFFAKTDEICYCLAPSCPDRYKKLGNAGSGAIRKNRKTPRGDGNRNIATKSIPTASNLDETCPSTDESKSASPGSSSGAQSDYSGTGNEIQPTKRRIIAATAGSGLPANPTEHSNVAKKSTRNRPPKQ